MDSPRKQNGFNLSSGLFECQKRVLPQMKLIPRMDTPPIFAAGGCQSLREAGRGSPRLAALGFPLIIGATNTEATP
jgi:hypothetical protein